MPSLTEKPSTNETGQPKIKAIVLTSTSSVSDYSNLKIKEEDYPKIEKDDQVIVRIKATGLNFAELMQRQGLYRPEIKTPYTPGYEGSGLVEAVGAGVTEFQVNDRVIVFNSHNIWKEVVILPKTNLFKIPDEMSFEDAAGLVVNYMTAYQILFRMASIKENESVLVHMAAGGVGTAATQLAKTVPGVKVFGTASAAKHDMIREIGVDYPIDYTKSDYVEEIKKISPSGVDVVMDPLNGEHSIKGYNILKPLGRIVHFGAASATSESRSYFNAFKSWLKCLSTDSFKILTENKSISGYHLAVLLNNPDFLQTAMVDMNKLIDLYVQGKIKIKIDSTYSYSKIGEAMKRMHSRLNIGKIILKPDSECTPLTTPEEVKVALASNGDVKQVSSKQEENNGAAAEAPQNVEETKKEAEQTNSNEEPKVEEKTNGTHEQHEDQPAPVEAN